ESWPGAAIFEERLLRGHELRRPRAVTQAALLPLFRNRHSRTKGTNAQPTLTSDVRRDGSRPGVSPRARATGPGAADRTRLLRRRAGVPRLGPHGGRGLRDVEAGVGASHVHTAITAPAA